MLWGEKPPVKWRSKQIKISGMSSLLRAQENSVMQGDLAWAPCSPKMQGTPWGCESCSPNQKISFVSISLADLTMNFSTSGQGKHVLGHALLSCWITGYCLWLEGCVTTRKVFWHGWSILVKGLLSVAGMTDWQRSGLTEVNSILLLIPQDRCGWLRNQGSRFPKDLPCLLIGRRKASCLCCKLGMVQVKLWGNLRSKPCVMVWCSLHALCQEWSVSHTALRKVPGPCEIQRPKKHYLLLAEDQTARTYGKAQLLWRQRVCQAAGFVRDNQPRRLHLICGLFKKYSLTVFRVLSHSDHGLSEALSLLFLPHDK